MTKAHSLIIGASIVLGCLILNLRGTPATGQPPQLPQAQYQIAAAAQGGAVKVFVMETMTGRIWTRVDQPTEPGTWKAAESPVK